MNDPILNGIAGAVQVATALQAAALRKRQFEADEEQRRFDREAQSADIVRGLLGIGARPADDFDLAEAEAGVSLRSPGSIVGQIPDGGIKGRIRTVAGDKWVMPTGKEMQAFSLAQRLKEAAAIGEAENARKIAYEKLVRDQLGITLTPEAETQLGLQAGTRIPLDALRSLFPTMASYRRSDVMEKRPGPAQRVPNITLAGDAKGQYANWYNPKTGKVETQRIADVKPVAPRASGGGRTGTGTTPEERQRVREEAARNTLQSLIDAEQRKEDDLWKQVAFDEGVLESGQAKGPQETFHRSRVKSNREAIQKIQQRKAALIGRKDGAAAGAAARRQLGLSDSTAPGAAPPPAAKAPAKVAPKVTPKKGERRTYQGHEYEFDGREWKLRKAV